MEVWKGESNGREGGSVCDEVTAGTDQCPAAQIRRAMPRSRPGSLLSTPALMAAASRELARPADKPAADKLCSTVSCNKNTSLPKSFHGHIYLMCTLSHGNVFRIEFGLKFRVSPPTSAEPSAVRSVPRDSRSTSPNVSFKQRG